MSNRQILLETIANTAFYYGREISPAVVAMMADDLGAFPPSDCIAAYSAYRQNGKNKSFPLPAQIIEMLEGGNHKNSSNVLVTKMIAAIKKHDSSWCKRLPKDSYAGGSFETEFLHELGAEAWHVVKLHGGWPNFCEAFWNSGNETSFKAQIRDLCEGVIERQKLGTLLPFSNFPALDHEPAEQLKVPNNQQIELLRDESKELGDVRLMAQIASLTKKMGAS